jgi:hypothetical protein
MSVGRKSQTIDYSVMGRIYYVDITLYNLIAQNMYSVTD